MRWALRPSSNLAWMTARQAAQELPFRRLECGPGEEAQVDFGTGAPVVSADGKRRRPYVFRIVLSHSRKAYSEAVYRQTTDNFLLCLENAFVSFGGAVQRLVLDNLRAAVKKADWFDPDLNPRVLSFARHYGTVFLPTKPYTPRLKGKIENGVKYVKNNALRARVFDSLQAENAFLLDWEQLAVHAKTEPGRFCTDPRHIPREKVSAVERGTDALLRQVAAIGPHAGEWSAAMVQARGVEGVRVLVGLKALTGKHALAEIDRACQAALAHGAYRLRTIRELLRRQTDTPQQQQFEFLAEHPVIRPLSDYSLASLLQFRKERFDERDIG